MPLSRLLVTNWRRRDTHTHTYKTTPLYISLYAQKLWSSLLFFSPFVITKAHSYYLYTWIFASRELCLCIHYYYLYIYIGIKFSLRGVDWRNFTVTFRRRGIYESRACYIPFARVRKMRETPRRETMMRPVMISFASMSLLLCERGRERETFQFFCGEKKLVLSCRSFLPEPRAQIFSCAARVYIYRANIALDYRLINDRRLLFYKFRDPSLRKFDLFPFFFKKSLIRYTPYIHSAWLKFSLRIQSLDTCVCPDFFAEN